MAHVRVMVLTLGLTVLWCIPATGQTQGARSPERPRQTATRPSTGAQPVAPAPLYRDTWYDFVVRQFNPDHRDWGDWIEERRQALLDASVRSRYFKYSLVSTVLPTYGARSLGEGTVRPQPDEVHVRGKARRGPASRSLFE